jgi:hypothetical protein
MVCRHIVDDNSPVDRAIRTEPVDPADSGWQFLCKRRRHLADDCRVCGIDEILKLDPAIVEIIDVPGHVSFVKNDKGTTESGVDHVSRQAASWISE